jgi:hypothetical protein
MMAPAGLIECRFLAGLYPLAIGGSRPILFEKIFFSQIIRYPFDIDDCHRHSIRAMAKFVP